MGLNRHDHGLLGALVTLAAFIWLRDLRWLDNAADTLPILAGIPLLVWLGWPWRPSAQYRPPTPSAVALAAGLFALGVLVDSTLLLAASWTTLAWSWISRRFVDPSPPGHAKLLALGFISFPWITNDLERLGWWFRLSGAAGAEHVLRSFGYDVVRRGTFLLVDGFSVSVEPACSGLNGLQALLLAGTALACLRLRHTSLFWWNLPLLAAAAWVANLIRIVFGSAVGASLPPAMAMRWVGPLHLAAGWLSLAAMFALCWFLFTAEARATRREQRERFRWPWLELVLLAFAGWRGRDLGQAWLTAPFDRLGWVAFAIWILPLTVFRSRLMAVRPWALCVPWRAGMGLALIVAGDMADLNFSRHLGLAFMLAAFAPRRGMWFWWLGAVAWLPALGWVGSRAGVPPEWVGALRVFTATLAAAAAVYRRPSADPIPFDYARRQQISP